MFPEIRVHEHLHFAVTQITADGSKRDVDPAIYLAEIAEKGNIETKALHDGNDLLAKYKADPAHAQRDSKVQSPEEWMKKLLSSEDSGIGLSDSNDPIIDMVVTAFSSLMALAVIIDNKDEKSQLAAVSDMANRRTIDLTSLLPNMKTCDIVVNEDNKAVLKADNGNVQFIRELSSNELSRLSVILNNPNLSDESKRMRIAGMVNSIVLSYQVSENFEQCLSEQQNRNEQIRR